MHIGSTSQEKTKNPSMDLFIYHNVLVQIANNVSITKNQFVHIVGQSWMQKLQRIQQSTRKSAFFMKKISIYRNDFIIFCLRNCSGVNCVAFLNSFIKCPRLLNPLSRQTSITGSSVVLNNVVA